MCERRGEGWPVEAESLKIREYKKIGGSRYRPRIRVRMTACKDGIRKRGN